MEFKGDVIITDPCYFIKDKDWEKSEYGNNLKQFGINTFLSSGTIYGDWSCTTFEKGTYKKLGKFCADAGMVTVALLKEVLQYNPDFDYHITNPFTTTWLKDFDGDITICNDGEEVWIEGKGSVNFVTKQTGL
jgi:hypothetical protein